MLFKMYTNKEIGKNKKKWKWSCLVNDKGLTRKEEKMFLKLTDYVGILEKDTYRKCGISLSEYMYPSRQTLSKVKHFLANPK